MQYPKWLTVALISIVGFFCIAFFNAVSSGNESNTVKTAVTTETVSNLQKSLDDLTKIVKDSSKEQQASLNAIMHDTSTAKERIASLEAWRTSTDMRLKRIEDTADRIETEVKKR